MPSPNDLSTFMSDEKSPPPLHESVLLPLEVRYRRSSPSKTSFTGSESEVLKLFDDLLAIGGPICVSREATFLHLLHEYNIDKNALQHIAVTRLKGSFSKTTYSAIAGVFGLDPADSDLINTPQCNMNRSWLPLEVVRGICRDVEAAHIQCGPMVIYDREEVRRRYITTILGRVIHLFGQEVMDRPEDLLRRRVTDPGRFWHQFVAFGVTVVMFIQVRRDLLVGKARADQIAQALAEADACDYGNSSFGLWAPILGILSDGDDFEFLVYDSSTRGFALSARMMGLEDFQSGVDFLRSVKSVAEYMYDMFLTGYINALRAVLERSTQPAERSKWEASLQFAESALAYARHAASLATDGKLAAAEEAAMTAVEMVDRIAKEAPGASAEDMSGTRAEGGASLMDAWVDEQIMRL